MDFIFASFFLGFFFSFSTYKLLEKGLNFKLAIASTTTSSIFSRSSSS